MSPDLFPVQLSFTKQATYNLSRRDTSTLIVCAPNVKPILQKIIPEASKVFNNLARLDIVGRVCAPFKLFASFVMDVDKLKPDVVDGDYNAIINDVEDKWFKTGIYCDQLQSLSTKKCEILPKFMYKGNKKFQLYSEMFKKKEITPFNGNIEFKESSPYMVYLKSVVKDVNGKMVQNIFDMMSGKAIRFEPSTTGSKSDL